MRLEGFKNKRTRVAILKALRTEYPTPIDTKVLLFVMDSYGYPLTDDDLHRHLHYLEEKGYLKVERRKGFHLSFVSMTAAGWDLYDGIKEDDGIDAEL